MKVRASLAGVLTVLGFMVWTSATAAERSRRNAEPRRAQLVSLIRARQKEVDRLARQLDRLQEESTRVQRSLLRRQNVDTARVRREELLAGLAAVQGPGVQVVLRDSARTARNPTLRDALRIRDTDLQLVVNSLWEAGAEAVAINGQRLVATSAVRIAGDTVTVNFRPLTSPYRVVAIGADRKRFDRSSVARRFHEWVSAYGLGFKVSGKGRIRVDGFAGRTTPAHAEPVGKGAG